MKLLLFAGKTFFFSFYRGKKNQNFDWALMMSWTIIFLSVQLIKETISPLIRITISSGCILVYFCLFHGMLTIMVIILWISVLFWTLCWEACSCQLVSLLGGVLNNNLFSGYDYEHALNILHFCLCFYSFRLLFQIL